MQLYTVYENGVLRKVDKLNFNEARAFLIDDINTIYLWFGSKTSKKKREFAVNRANILNAKRKGIAKIQNIFQGKEFGAFLAIMDILKKGLKPDAFIDKRPELEIEFEGTMELIEAGIDPDFEAEITIAAHKLSQEKNSYEDLCRKLAELQISFLKGKGKASEKEIQKKTDDIYKSSSTYDELCWLIAELSKLLEET
ncbi:MAG: hypothetical protein ACFFBV_06295 [Promethearchaeota archaeon]